MKVENIYGLGDCWTPEAKVLLLASRRALRPSEREALSSYLSGPLDWDLLIGLADYHRTIGFLHLHICGGDEMASLVPGDVRRKLTGLHNAAVADAMRAAQGLEEIAAALDGASVPALLLRGLALTETLYGTMQLRFFRDIDLAVRPDHVPVVAKCLQRLGYEFLEHHPTTFVRGRVMVDLHTDLLNRSRIRTRRFLMESDEPIWAASEPLWGPLRVPSRLDNLLLCAVHAQKHSFREWIWLVDIRELLLQGDGDIDWDALADRAEVFRAGPSLAFVIHLLAALWGLEVTPDIRHFMERYPLSAVERLLLGRILKGADLDRFGDLMFLGALPTWGRKLAYLAELAFPRPAVLRQVFCFRSSAYVPLAYLWRTLQLARLACREGVRLLRPRPFRP